MTGEKRVRRSRKQLLISNMEKIEGKISSHKEALTALEKELENVKNELKGIQEAEEKAAEKANMQEVLKMLKKKDMSIDQLKSIIEEN